MTVCRTIAEVLAAADADSRDDPPLSQDQAGLVAALLAPHRDMLASPRGVPDGPAAEPR
jgi:hypothetical protein